MEPASIKSIYALGFRPILLLASKPPGTVWGTPVTQAETASTTTATASNSNATPDRPRAQESAFPTLPTSAYQICVKRSMT